MQTDVILRDFKPEDVDDVIHLIAHGFHGKFQHLIRRSAEEVAKLLSTPGFIETAPYEGYVIAEKGGVVIGVMMLKWKNQETPKTDIAIMKFIKTHGLRPLLNLLLAFIASLHFPKKNECYVELLAVKESIRGQGVGSQLLQYAESVAREYHHTHLTLTVAASNRARNLYMREGFSSVKEDSSRFTQYVLGTRDWIFMRKDI